MNIRTKLIVMLAVPLVALAVVAFAGFAGQNADLEVNEDAKASVATITNLDRLWWIVADERLAVLGDATPEEIAEAAAVTDAVVEEIADSTDTTGAAVVAEAIALLPADRSAGGLDALDAYNDALDVLDNGIEAQPLAGLNSDAALTVTAVVHAHDASRKQEDAWLALKNLENLNTTTVRNLISSFGAAQTLRDITADDRLTNGDQLFLDAVRSPSAAQLGQIEALVLSDLARAEGAVLTDTFVDDAISSLPSISLFDALENNRAEWKSADEVARQILIEDITETQTDIATARSRSLFLALVGGLLLFTLIFVIGRSIVGPLSRLMANAEVMTNERLPAAVAQLRTLGSSDETPQLAPIPKETDDEIGTIVEAFNDMQVSALRVATDQARSRRNVAEMFVNLGRRNQQLNHRMITMISDLERDEQDPETLRGLYQLDHLATRMRRNAESLLVLAGNRSPRQWKKPVAFDDVVRSSLAEVEYFERIEIGELPEVDMTGAVVADITHMLAELLDNATNFSDPSSMVHISALETHTAVELQIRDNGFGIDEEDLHILNERLNNPPELDEAPSRLLGLFVVGRLAEQHGVQVELRSVTGEGTTATVTIPKTHFPVEIGENPIDTPAPIAVNADNAADFFAQEAILADDAQLEHAELDEAEEVTAEVIPLPIPDAVSESSSDDAHGEVADLLPIDTTPVAEIDEAPVEIPDLDAEPQFADEPAEIPVAEEAPVVEEVLVQEAPVAEEAPVVEEVLVQEAPVAEEAPVAPVAEEAKQTDEPAESDQNAAEPAPMAPSAAGQLTEDSWPLTKLNPAPSREATPMDVAQRSAEVDSPAPEVAVEETVAAAPTPEAPVAEPVVEAAAVSEAPVPQAPAPATAAPVQAQVQVEEQVEVQEVVQEVVPATPIVEEAALPAPPVMQQPMPEPPAKAAPAAPVTPEVTTEPATPVAEAPAAPQSPSFGGLPTRMPQATIEEVESAPKVLPLTIEEDDAAASDKATSSISFGHFARGAVAASEASANDEGENS